MFGSWYLFEQLLVELYVDWLRAHSCADILWEDLHAIGWKCWTNCFICSAYIAACVVGDLQGHGFASWYFFEQLLVEL